MPPRPRKEHLNPTRWGATQRLHYNGKTLINNGLVRGRDEGPQRRWGAFAENPQAGQNRVVIFQDSLGEGPGRDCHQQDAILHYFRSAALGEDGINQCWPQHSNLFNNREIDTTNPLGHHLEDVANHDRVIDATPHARLDMSTMAAGVMPLGNGDAVVTSV